MMRVRSDVKSESPSESVTVKVKVTVRQMGDAYVLAARREEH